MEVRQLHPDGVDSYRELRLRALREAPYAFNTTYEQAAARPDSAWLELMGRFANGRDCSVFVLDRGDGQLAGLVCVRSGSPERSATITQMWLDAVLRGQGWAERLLRAAERFAASRGATRAELLVETDNARAARFYERCGYARTGAVESDRRGGPAIQFARVLNEDAPRQRWAPLARRRASAVTSSDGRVTNRPGRWTGSDGATEAAPWTAP